AAMPSTSGDRFLDHAIIYALIELNAPAETVRGLAATDPAIRRAAVIALDQMRSSSLTREQVAPLLATDNAALQQAVLEVIERHQGWAPEIAPLIATWLADTQPNAERVAAARATLIAFCREKSIQKVIGQALANSATAPSIQTILLDVIARCDLTEIPHDWEQQIDRYLRTGNEQLLRQTIPTAAARNRQGLFDVVLIEIAHNTSIASDVRLAALAARNGSDRSLSDADLQFLTSYLRNEAAPLDRLTAATVLGRASLTPAQLGELIRYVESAGPLELASLLGAYDAEGSEALGLRLVAALDKSPGFDSLSVGRVEQLMAKYPSAVRAMSQPLLGRLNAGLEQQRRHLANSAPLLAGGDAANGKKLFFGSKATCSACHRAGTQGGAIGPDLTKVGQIRAPMDLLESVVYPSSSFVRGYESFQVVTDAGQSYIGILGRETADAVFLRTAQREEVRIPRAAIDELVPSKLSIMPQGFDRLLSPQEMRDLLAYLQSLK
ncbi:MAG TPA: c-type cytochrome, partial [Pirellulales bacterium]|nr:c-type cytochrome [Pirellulales bacterium]